MAQLLLIAVVSLVIVGVLANRYLKTETQKKKDLETHLCQPNVPRTNHLIVIEKDILAPTRTVAKLCDTVTVINKDSKTRYMAFGAHEHHIVYDNHDVQVLSASQSFSFTLVDLGTYEIHDHLQDEVQGTFTVVQN
jgi:hypothetical protein